MQSEAFAGALMAAATLYMPVMLAFWFAPPLAASHSTGPAKALFFSFAAAMMNWRAVSAYGAVTAGVTLLIPLGLLAGLGALFAGSVAVPPGAAWLHPPAFVLPSL